ncbi:hypothetical protein [Flavobacterium psychraquaticum]|uniref:hypothetical protein n=1 Tax=Flavobacterium psychraquaticum TaxID=3103958 RepID=UPI002ACDAB71|nr:hypothetical protein [Flavobacterium sp. LB-N7T]
MKNIITLCFLIPVFSFAQNTSCDYEIDEKTDTTSLKVIPQKLMHEKNFGNTSEFLFFSLVNEDGIPYLNIQQLQKSKDFIPTSCLSKNSKIVVQLDNGKFITLINAFEETCSDLNYDSAEKNNLRILSGYFYFTKTNYEQFKESSVSLMRIQFGSETKDYVLKSSLVSETLGTTSSPSTYFMDYLKCIE